MKSEIKNLNSHVEELCEKERNRRQTVFNAGWLALTENERRLAWEIMGEFKTLRDSNQMSTDSALEAEVQKWHNSQPPDKKAIADKMLSWNRKTS